MSRDGSTLWVPPHLRDDAIREAAVPFASLVQNQEDLTKAVRGMVVAIARTFGDEKERKAGTTPSITQGEMRRRAKICENFFQRCRRDLGFSVEKSIDHMYAALRARLDGNDYDPPQEKETKLWVPT